MKRIIVLLALYLTAFAQAQDTITLEDTGGFISKLVYDWTSDGAGAATGRSLVVVPGILFGVATTPDTTNVPTDLYDVVVKQAFTNTSGGVTVLAADLTAGAVANRSSTVVQWTDFWPTSILTSGGFIQIEVTNAGSAKEGRIEFYIYRTLAIIPEGGNGIPFGGVSTQLLQNSGNGVAKWITMSGDSTIADGGNLQLADPLLIEGLTMTGILTTGSAPTTVTNADGTLKLAALENRSDLAGTSNQVILSASGTNTLLGALDVTLSLPQDIHTAASPTFAGITGTGVLIMGSAPTTLTNADGTLILSALSTGADLLGTANQVTVSSGTGTLIGGSDATLSLPNIVNLGVDDTTGGQTILFGTSGSITGGLLRLHNAADDDTNVEFWELTTNVDFEIKDDGGTSILTIDDATFDMTLSNNLIVNGTGTSQFAGAIGLENTTTTAKLTLKREAAAIGANDILVDIVMGGHDTDDSLDITEGARWLLQADAAWSAGSTPTRIVLSTIPVGSTADVFNWTFESDGDLTLDGGGDITLTGGKIESTSTLLTIESENAVFIDVDSGGDTGLSNFSVTGEGGTVALITAFSDTPGISFFDQGNTAAGGAKSVWFSTKTSDDIAALANRSGLYAVDVSSSSELFAIGENGDKTQLTTHNFSRIPDGKSEAGAWSHFSVDKDGNYTTVDMLLLARKVEELTGVKLVYKGKVTDPNKEIEDDLVKTSAHSGARFNSVRGW